MWKRASQELAAEAAPTKSGVRAPHRGCNHPGNIASGSTSAVLVEMHALLAQQPLQPTFLERVHGFGGAADPLATDEQLRNGLAAGARGQHRTDLAAAVVDLVIGGVQVDGAIRNRTRREQLAQRPAELAPLQREQHHRLRGIGEHLRDEGVRVRGRFRRRRDSAGRGRRGDRRAGAVDAGSSKRAPGVEREISSSSAVMSTPTPSNNGVLR